MNTKKSQKNKELLADEKKYNVKIVVEHKDKGIVEIPLTKRECHDMVDFSYMMDCDQCMNILTINKCMKSWDSLHNKFEHLVFDVLGEGKWYSLDKNENIKAVHVKYMVKKPRWKKSS